MPPLVVVMSVKTPVKIRIDSPTRDVLRSLKKGGDNFDDVVRRLIVLHSEKEGWPTPEALKELLDIEKEEG